MEYVICYQINIIGSAYSVEAVGPHYNPIASPNGEQNHHGEIYVFAEIKFFIHITYHINQIN